MGNNMPMSRGYTQELDGEAWGKLVSNGGPCPCCIRHCHHLWDPVPYVTLPFKTRIWHFQSRCSIWRHKMLWLLFYPLECKSTSFSLLNKGKLLKIQNPGLLRPFNFSTIQIKCFIFIWEPEPFFYGTCIVQFQAVKL